MLRGSVLKAALSQLAGVGRKIVPMSEEKVLGRVMRDAVPMAESIIANSGFSYSPRLGRMLEAGKDYGHMMAVIKEIPGARMPIKNKKDVAELAQAIKTIAKDPVLLKRLRRGENIGGWVTGRDILTIDPSVRHLSKDVATLRGMNAAQDAGFSLHNYDEFPLKYNTGVMLEDLNYPGEFNDLLLPDYDVRQAALKRLAAKGIGGIATAGLTGGYLGARD